MNTEVRGGIYTLFGTVSMLQQSISQVLSSIYEPIVASVFAPEEERTKILFQKVDQYEFPVVATLLLYVTLRHPELVLLVSGKPKPNIQHQRQRYFSGVFL